MNAPVGKENPDDENSDRSQSGRTFGHEKLTRALAYKEVLMSRNVADLLWDMLAKAGVKRCYGIVGDALNPVVDGLRRNGQIELVHVATFRCGDSALQLNLPLTETAQNVVPVAVTTAESLKK